MIIFDHDKCLKCGGCAKECIVKIIHFTPGNFPAVAAADNAYCINCQHCLTVCPANAVTCNGKTAAECLPNGNLPEPETLSSLLAMRRSCRRYRPEVLTDAELKMIKSALTWSPTGCNDRRLIFTIVETAEAMDFFRNTTAAFLRKLLKSRIISIFYPRIQRYIDAICSGEDVIYRNAPHMIIVSTPKKAPCAEADPWIALAYLDTLLQSMKLGSCWCGFALHAFRWCRPLRKKLDLPRGYKVGAVLLFGRPEVNYLRIPPRDQYRIDQL